MGSVIYAISTRVRTQSDPVSDDSGDGDGGEEVSSKLVVAGGDAAEVLEPAEGVFDPPAVAVAALVVLDGPLAVGPSWNDRNCVLVAELTAEAVGVVALVTDQARGRREPTEKARSNRDVAHLATGQMEHNGPPEEVRDHVDLGGLTAA